MLGWCPSPSLHNRPTSCRSCIPHNHEAAHFSVFNDDVPALQPSHQIVIGFDLGIAADGSKSLHESPRSVLEPHPPQSGSPRSPLSALGSLLAGRACARSGGIKVAEISTDAHAYHNVLKSEHVACCIDSVGRYTTSDSVALSKPNKAIPFKNQRRERHPLFSTCGDIHPYHSRSSSLLSSDDEDDCDDCDMDNSKSIFSAASPVSHHFMLNDQTMDFLSKCFRCRRRLTDGKDIFMYRGDQAFCSQECRYRQIVSDERKHKTPVVTPCFLRHSSDHRKVAREAQAVLA